MRELNMGLCEGRHEMREVTDGYVFPSVIDPTDIIGLNKRARMVLGAVDGPVHLNLYVTGLSVALVAVINFCNEAKMPLTLWHFNRDTGSYYPQEVYQ